MSNKYEHKNGFGSLFRNESATKENNQPEYSGSIKLQDGTLQQIGGWVKESNGKKFFSLRLKDPYVKPEEGAENPPEEKEEEESPDLPF